jgi:hypothetical protein
MFFYKKKHKRRKGNKGKCIDTSGCLKSKTKKRFGLSAEEMSTLVYQLVEKPKIPIVHVV